MNVLHMILVYGSSAANDGHGSENGNFYGPLFFFIVTGIIALIAYLPNRGYASWDKGSIPKNFKPTKENIFELYIAAGCAIIARDRGRSRNKFGAMNQYLNNHFPEEFYDFKESYAYSLKNILKIDELCKWCNKYFDQLQKVQLLNFITEIAVSDGEISDLEKQHIFLVTKKMNLSFDCINEEFREFWHEETTTKAAAGINWRKKYLEALGVSETATENEIKTAYRKLVKLTHPDRFIHESREVQESKIMEFRKIQEAYDNLMEN